MKLPLRLHYAPDNASLIIRLALEELGCAYETVLVDRAIRAQDSADYRRINPNGLIPAIETPHGAIFETAAILLWLDEAYPGALAPHPGNPRRGDFLKWLIFLANTVHPALRMTFYADKYIGPDAKLEAALRARTQQNIARHLNTLDAHATGAVFGAPDPSLIDLYLAPMLRWMALYPTGGTGWFDLGQWPALYAITRSMDTRASTQRIAALEGLGPTPFSAPCLAAPPVGSAT
ncbi:glutathione S-transferase family protein [Roseovarius pelagicus]|uniref:Glutathione S-transferase family protein n=1 Tax=Roseovarius pelagicus TaxID=2980108 RepID=A0ABY6DAK9_9RHOB|nr:glutathione S-transferase family protein [Roseovarius pelagicus]UXX83138.1 glutathione S-transferase family protein [Roseovarius pelagicus]